MSFDGGRLCPKCRGTGVDCSTHHRFTTGGRDDRSCPACLGNGFVSSEETADPLASVRQSEGVAVRVHRQVVNVLFICGRNRLRSPTAEQVFADWPGVETASAGLNPEAESPVTAEVLEWAEIIFVMEPAQRSKLSSRFQPYLRDRRVICLGIPDRYEFMEPELIRILQEKVPRYLPRA